MSVTNEPSAAQKFHGERVEARQRERSAFPPGGQPSAAEVAAFLEDLFITGLLLSLIAEPPKAKAEVKVEPQPEPEHAAPTPFMKFWKDTNEKLLAEHRPLLNYGEAQERFKRVVEETPENTMTFVGRAGVGIRAFPRFGRYIAQYRGRDDSWHTVGGFMHPTVYRTAEEALKDASLHKPR